MPFLSAAAVVKNLNVDPAGKPPESPNWRGTA